jgi:hypothetical protein
MINSISSVSVWTNGILGSKKSKNRNDIVNPGSPKNTKDSIEIPANDNCITNCGTIHYYPGVVFDGLNNNPPSETTYVAIDLSPSTTDEYYIQVQHRSDSNNVNYTITLNLKDCKITRIDYPSGTETDFNMVSQSSTVDEMNAYNDELTLIKNGLNDAFAGFTEFSEFTDFIECERQQINQMIIAAGVKENQKAVDKLSVFPNPVNSILNIQLPTIADQDIKVKIFNVAGQEVKELTIPKGEKAVEWNVKENNISSGVYIYQIKVNNEVMKGKIQVLN